jgi:hypothetical protein
VRARDGKCVECGTADDLHAHHIKPKHSHPELKLDPNNGKTLCYRCHKREHEKNRPPRVRSSRPHRATVERALLAKVQRLEAENSLLRDRCRAYDKRAGEARILASPTCHSSYG